MKCRFGVIFFLLFLSYSWSFAEDGCDNKAEIPPTFIGRVLKWAKDLTQVKKKPRTTAAVILSPQAASEEQSYKYEDITPPPFDTAKIRPYPKNLFIKEADQALSEIRAARKAGQDEQKQAMQTLEKRIKDEYIRVRDLFILTNAIIAVPRDRPRFALTNLFRNLRYGPYGSFADTNPSYLPNLHTLQERGKKEFENEKKENFDTWFTLALKQRMDEQDYDELILLFEKSYKVLTNRRLPWILKTKIQDHIPSLSPLFDQITKTMNQAESSLLTFLIENARELEEQMDALYALLASTDHEAADPDEFFKSKQGGRSYWLGELMEKYFRPLHLIKEPDLESRLWVSLQESEARLKYLESLFFKDNFGVPTSELRRKDAQKDFDQIKADLFQADYVALVQALTAQNGQLTNLVSSRNNDFALELLMINARRPYYLNPNLDSEFQRKIILKDILTRKKLLQSALNITRQQLSASYGRSQRQALQYNTALINASLLKAAVAAFKQKAEKLSYLIRDNLDEWIATTAHFKVDLITGLIPVYGELALPEKDLIQHAFEALTLEMEAEATHPENGNIQPILNKINDFFKLIERTVEMLHQKHEQLFFEKNKMLAALEHQPRNYFTADELKIIEERGLSSASMQRGIDRTSLLDEERSIIDYLEKNRLVVLKCLGTGGLASVYLARRGVDLFAVKVLRNPSLLSNFKASIELTKQVTEQTGSSHIVKALEFVPFGPHPFALLEYVPAPDLNSLVKKKKYLRPADIVEILLQIVEGLKDVHQIGPFYDVKPSNVLILKNKVKLTDPGGGVHNPDKLVTSIRSASADFDIMQSIAFSPPNETDPTDKSRDIYALGATLYVLMTGGELPEGMTAPSEVLALHNAVILKSWSSEALALADDFFRKTWKKKGLRLESLSTVKEILLALREKLPDSTPDLERLSSEKGPDPIEADFEEYASTSASAAMRLEPAPSIKPAPETITFELPEDLEPRSNEADSKPKEKNFE